MDFLFLSFPPHQQQQQEQLQENIVNNNSQQTTFIINETMIHQKKYVPEKEINNNISSANIYNNHYYHLHHHHHHHPQQQQQQQHQSGSLKKKFKSVETILIIIVWYFFSFVAIFLSKHVIDHQSVDLLFFCAIQLGISAFMAYINIQLPTKKPSDDSKCPQHKDLSHFNRDVYFSMVIIGFMRLLVIYMGLLSMKHVALSFMETVKSSAPLFTVAISFVVLKEKSGVLTQASILPIMVGLLLCSIFEISFTWLGFLAALAANVAECLQFVLSKIFLGSKMNPSDFQLYSSVTGLLSIIPLSLFLFDINIFMSMGGRSLAIMLIVGISYYLQTYMAWLLMEFLSPVTHSICNTMKCGVAVWLSVPIFGNHVTLWSGFGSCLVLVGVVLYQKARNFEKLQRRSTVTSPSSPTSSSTTTMATTRTMMSSYSNTSAVGKEKNSCGDVDVISGGDGDDVVGRGGIDDDDGCEFIHGDGLMMTSIGDVHVVGDDDDGANISEGMIQNING